MRQNFQEMTMNVEAADDGVFVRLSRSVSEIVMTPAEAEFYADELRKVAKAVRDKRTNAGIDTGIIRSQ